MSTPRLSIVLMTCMSLTGYCLTATLAAQPTLTPEAAALVRMLKTTPAQADWFAPEFLAQVQPSQIDQIVKQYTGQFGPFQHAEGSAPSFTVYLEHGTFPAKIVLNADGKISGLWFGLAEPLKPVSLDDTVGSFAKLPGKVSVTVLEEGKPRASLHPDDPLAVGSAFKLAILNALTEQSSKHPPSEVVPLRPEWKTLPTGVLQTWPDGTPLTIATYALDMISISDNTAADALLSIGGRDAVERFAPRNKPFLSVSQAMTLKARSNSAVLTRYRAADEAARRNMLKEIDDLPAPKLEDIAANGDPSATDIEWFFTANELCSLIARVAGSPAMRVNPGLAKPEDWQQIAFKGGSEGGVLNLTTALTGKNGKHYCVAATWNNTAALSETQFYTPYNQILSSLAKESKGK